MATAFQLTIDCTDSARLSSFWQAALHYVETPPPQGAPSWGEYFRARGLPEEEVREIEELGYDKISDPDGVGPRIWFQVVPEGKVVKNRVHLDLLITDRTAPLEDRKALVDKECERLRALGASVFRVLYTEGHDYYGIVMQDPEGNEFCLS
jgi:glyoxalase superfamily protein